MKIVPRWAIRVAGTLALASVPTVALAEQTPWCSEETGPSTCAPSKAAHGLHCSGDYCDNVALECEYSGGVNFINPQWSRWFSEELSTGPLGPLHNRHICSAGTGSLGVVTGIKCSGDYCDNISLQCSEAWNVTPQGIWPVTISPQNCFWTGPISEETPSYVSWDRFISGVLCLGDYCDDKLLYMCTW